MFRKISPEQIQDNPFALIGKDWALLTAAKADGSFNSMTASWGGVGILWNKPVCYLFVRPQRYTHEFTEEGDRLTASFFGEGYRKQLTLCGRVSGRDTDKVAACGFTPVREDGAVYYEEARLVLVCRKLYTGKIDPDGFFDKELLSNYPAADYHTVYVYEIEEVLIKD